MNSSNPIGAYVTGPVAGRQPLRSGKVRDLYDLGGNLLLVASDRISAFDVVFAEPVPGKGILLNTISDYWLTETSSIVKNHRITSRVEDMNMLSDADRERLRGRAMLCVKTTPLPFEFVVRGYLSGSGWSDYKKTGSICGIALPAGLRESDRLPAPILTPTTKAEAGHDEPVAFGVLEDTLGARLAQEARSIALQIYQFASRLAAARGIIIADTKFEFGMHQGACTLIDEVLTPDSSRFWPADRYQPGGPQPSFDKQFLRDYLLSTGWNRQPPPPALPGEIIEKTAQKYRDICALLTMGTPARVDR